MVSKPFTHSGDYILVNKKNCKINKIEIPKIFYKKEKIIDFLVIMHPYLLILVS